MMRLALLLPARALLLATLVCMLPAAASAQFGAPRAVTGITFESYAFDEPEQVDFDRVDLLTIPLTGGVRLARNVELSLGSAWARANLRRRDGSEATLTGPTDTEVRLTFSLARDRVRLSAIGVLPTGQTDLSVAEMDLIGLVASDLLPFAISSWGTGGGVGASAAFVVPFDETSVGFSAGYIVAREYEPLGAESFTYRPGNHVQLRAAVDHTFGSAGKASVQVTFQQFSTDEFAGANLYSAGDRLQAVGSFAFATGARGNALVYAGLLWRDTGRFSDTSRITPAQDLVYAGAALRQPLGPIVLLPLADVRILSSDEDTNQGYTVDIGAGIELPVGAFELVPVVRGRFGNVEVRPGQESDFTGFRLGLSLRTRMFAR
jgi:hypothetical protein